MQRARFNCTITALSLMSVVVRTRYGTAATAMTAMTALHVTSAATAVLQRRNWLLLSVVALGMASHQGAAVEVCRGPIRGAVSCPPIVIDGILGIPVSGWPSKTTGQTESEYPSRTFIPFACDAPVISISPDHGVPRDYDAYHLRNNSNEAVCVDVSLTVLEQSSSDYMVRAYSPFFAPSQVQANWYGDPGVSSNIPPQITSFSTPIDAQQTFEIVVFNMNLTGSGNDYTLTLSDPECALTTRIFADGFD